MKLPNWFHRFLCRFDIHFQGQWEPEGLRCIHCGKFKSKAEVMADRHGI